MLIKTLWIIETLVVKVLGICLNTKFNKTQ